MQTLKKYALLFAALALIILGGTLLVHDYKTIKAAWLGLIGAIMSMAAGVVLGIYLDRKNMLPE